MASSLSLSSGFDVSPCPELGDFPPSCCPQPPEKDQDSLFTVVKIIFCRWYYSGLQTELEIDRNVCQS
jgi:hypothetical protein